MALYYMLRRASSCVVPLAIRTVGSARTVRGAALSVDNGKLRHELYQKSFVPSLHFSTAIDKEQSFDESLIRIIDSEIECAEEVEQHYRAEEIPDGFPFMIHDNPGESTILLKRVYKNEIIKVEVHMPDFGNVEDSDDDNGYYDGKTQPCIPLVVRVSKGSRLQLEFVITALPDEISIDSLSLKEQERYESHLANEGPDFWDLSENLQESFQKYLEFRGIKTSTIDFLYEYMISKNSKEYLQWLKKLRKFVDDYF
ncbi:uncharacterized protein At2g39795, mitochondrial-like [Cornus florida]|uniref:uncharacterized protein At2g39795, mitochondrial-like n=1 Tax=Cornus florida TaxID=4283 RepID=UPI00289855A9|nr:uncharacterized protein At2g39795, mitochondrial-like [Cornus florida]